MAGYALYLVWVGKTRVRTADSRLEMRHLPLAIVGTFGPVGRVN